MILPPFRLHRPRSIDEAIETARSLDGDFDYIAGGTDLLQNYKNRLNPKPHVISLTDIDELREINPTRIGCLARLADIERDPIIQKVHPGIVRAASQVASPLVRETATVGGNILVETRCFFFNQSFFWRQSKGFCLKADGDNCLVVPQKETCYATYSGDLAPVFLALDATFHLHGPEGKRDIRSREFFQPDGIRKHVMEKGEILTHVEIPGKRQTRSDYQKLRLRDSFDYPVLGVAGALRLDGKGNVEDLSVVINAVTWTPLIFEKITEKARGRELTEVRIESIAEEIQDLCQPVRNTYLSPPYRKKMIGVYVRRVLSALEAHGHAHAAADA